MTPPPSLGLSESTVNKRIKHPKTASKLVHVLTGLK